MAGERCYDGSPKRSWQEQRPDILNLPLSSLPMEERDAKGGGLWYRGKGPASIQATGIEVISFQLSSPEELKNDVSSQRPM